MSIDDDLNAHRNRLRRLRLLQFLSQAYPDALTDRMLLSLSQDDPELHTDMISVRRALHYLHDRGLAVLVSQSKVWLARCLPAGIDYLEGPDPGIDGISHPDEFMED